MSNPAPITLEQLFRFWRDLPHQRAAIPLLEADLRELGYPAAMRRDRPWFEAWSQDGKQPEQVMPPVPRSPATIAPLRVPYFSQNDNASGTGYRECFSSSCAMAAAAHGKVTSDDNYNRIRAQFGDTTDAQAQIAALRKLGLGARLITNCAPGMIEAELRAGRPVPVGWLHKGPISRPSGGGHWSVIIGCTADHWIHHDPNGEADLVNGGYVNHSGGRAVRYSRRNWDRRWEADGPASGWILQVLPTL